MAWFMAHRKHEILNLQLIEEPFYALGVHFGYESDTVLRKNYGDKLGKVIFIYARCYKFTRHEIL